MLPFKCLNLVFHSGRCSRDKVANVLDSNIEESEFEHQSRYNVRFQPNTLEKAMNLPLCPTHSHYCTSMKITFTLNNPQRLIYHSTKKPNQTNISLYITRFRCLNHRLIVIFSCYITLFQVQFLSVERRICRQHPPQRIYIYIRFPLWSLIEWA